MIELSIDIFSLLLFATLLLTGARGWKRGSDRANCIVNINAVQKGVRGFANMSGYNPGDVVPGLESLVVGPGAFFESLPPCPGGGSYTLGGNQVPPMGTVYMKCSLEATEDHLPPATGGW